MAHFAKLDDTNTVLEVNVLNNDVILVDGIESEQAGIDFLTGLHGYSNWKQTSYNGSFRKNYAGIGYVYNQDLDAFISPKPFESWVLDTDSCQWIAPQPRPTTGIWVWNESNQQWDEIQVIEQPDTEPKPINTREI